MTPPYYLPLYGVPEAGRSGTVPPNAVSGVGHIDSDPPNGGVTLCPPEGIGGDGRTFEECGNTGSFSRERTWSLADLAADVLQTAAYNGNPTPEYCAFRFGATSGQLFPAYRGGECKTIETVELNRFCADHDWGAVASHWVISGGTGLWVRNQDGGTVRTTMQGHGPSSQDAPGPAPEDWQDGIYWGLTFEGYVVNPSPPKELSLPDVNGSYGARLLFPIGSPPPDIHSTQNASANNGPSLDWSISATGYYLFEQPPPPPPPPPEVTVVETGDLARGVVGDRPVSGFDFDLDVTI